MIYYLGLWNDPQYVKWPERGKWWIITNIRYERYRYRFTDEEIDVKEGIISIQRNVVIRRGVFGKTIEIIPYEKIQYIHVDNSLIDRLTGIAHGHVSILASVQSRIQSFKRFPQQDIENLISQFRRTYH